MADQCIVCLENLDSALPVSQSLSGDCVDDDGGGNAAQPKPELEVPATPAAPKPAAAAPSTPGKTTTKIEDQPYVSNNVAADIDNIVNNDNIAVIQICGHVLHDSCLKAWTGKANSCPICRQAFHLVEVYDKVGGTLLSTYKVEDKKQVAEFDPSAWLDESPDEEEESRPCPICNTADHEDVLLLCDRCDAPYHTHCLGLNDVPRGSWLCMECVDIVGPEMRSSHPTFPGAQQGRSRPGNTFFPRTQARRRRERNRARADNWMGAWGQVSGRILDVAGIDLDSNDGDDALEEYRRSQQLRESERREYERWQQRIRIAGRLGAGNVFQRNIQDVVGQQGHPQAAPEPPRETREEVRAWGALDQLRGIASPGKKRPRSITTSPKSPARAAEPERRLKRPRTRRLPVQNEPGPSKTVPTSASPHHEERQGAAPSAQSPPPTAVGPSFLSSLLKEVEMSTSSDDDTVRNLFGGPPQPVEASSPAASPSSSAHNSPRSLSLTPPPVRSASPVLSLSSHIEPLYPPANYSPTRSNGETSDSENRSYSNRAGSGSPELRQPRPQRRQEPLRLADASPTRNGLSLDLKQSINNIVRAALKPHWKSSQLTADQYSTINRSVSHKIYEEVSDTSTVDKDAQKLWEKIATKEVARLVSALKV